MQGHETTILHQKKCLLPHKTTLLGGQGEKGRFMGGEAFQGGMDCAVPLQGHCHAPSPSPQKKIHTFTSIHTDYLLIQRKKVIWLNLLKGWMHEI